MPAKSSAAIRQLIQERADHLCEYCHATELWQYVRFTIDHVIPLAQGGAHTPDNMALACFHCNRRKGQRSTSVDPITGEEVLLFNPRRDVWAEHFIWSPDGLWINGRSPEGRATIALLQMNRPWAINIRTADRSAGRHPPPGDPVE